VPPKSPRAIKIIASHLAIAIAPMGEP